MRAPWLGSWAASAAIVVSAVMSFGALANERAEPPLTPAQRQEREERIESNLLRRYPNQAAHDRAREASRAEIQLKITQSKERLALLIANRERLSDMGAETWGKPLPEKLQRMVDENGARIEAITMLIRNQEAYEHQMNDVYDRELVRLKRLWTDQEVNQRGGTRK